MKRIVLVPHCDKQEIIPARGVPADIEPWLLGDPPLSERGIREAHNLVADTVCVGPFHHIFCSRLQRAAQMAAIFSLRLGLDYTSLVGLGQHGSKNGPVVTMLPGHEAETIADWQREGVAAIRQIAARMRDGETALVMTHKPVVAGIVEACFDNFDPAKVDAAIGKWGKLRFVQIEIDDNNALRLA